METVPLTSHRTKEKSETKIVLKEMETGLRQYHVKSARILFSPQGKFSHGFNVICIISSLKAFNAPLID